MNKAFSTSGTASEFDAYPEYERNYQGALSELIFQEMYFEDLIFIKWQGSQSDGGYDFISKRGSKIDIKFTPYFTGNLMVSEWHMSKASSDILVLMTYNRRKTEILCRGYFERLEMIERGPRDTPHLSTKRTYIIEQKELKKL